VFRRGTDVLMPAFVPGVSALANRVLAKLPLARELALVDYFVARAEPQREAERPPSVSVICPCRDEKGNIREAVLRTPLMGPRTELIFIDGSSSDGTVEVFSSVLSWVLEQPIKDSLCGTKVLHRRDYDRIAEHRTFFGDFDPFGDFDLLFGAARLNMRIVDLPVRYRARTHGETKISRFSHGWLLLKMTALASPSSE
jgi:hypothetical protein